LYGFIVTVPFQSRLVERLLQDEHLNLSDGDNAPIRYALNGHLAVVERLLQDERVDPSDANNAAII